VAPTSNPAFDRPARSIWPAPGRSSAQAPSRFWPQPALPWGEVVAGYVRPGSRRHGRCRRRRSDRRLLVIRASLPEAQQQVARILGCNALHQPQGFPAGEGLTGARPGVGRSAAGDRAVGGEIVECTSATKPLQPRPPFGAKQYAVCNARLWPSRNSGLLGREAWPPPAEGAPKLRWHRLWCPKRHRNSGPIAARVQPGLPGRPPGSLICGVG